MSLKATIYRSIIAVVCALLGSQFALHASQPNVLFIAVDDMRVELGCYGQEHVISPNIDKLAASSVLFERAYCQQAVCNPSRASLLTGLRPETLGIWDLPTHLRQKRPNVVTLPQHFKNHGYHTQCIGKIFHNWRQDDYRGDAKSWSVESLMHYASHGSDTPQPGSGNTSDDLSGVPRTECYDVSDEAYFDGRIARLAEEQLQRRASQRQPFFLAVGFWKPHAPFNAPKKYWDLYRREDVAAPVNPSAPEGVPEIALHDSREILRGFRDRPGGVPTPEETIALRHGYLAAISFVDAQIGKLLRKLDELNLRDNTIVVLWSDHGFHLGEHSLWAKTSNFELDAHVPLIVRSPGIAPSRCANIVELLDIYPTLVELCALPDVTELDGESLVPLIRVTDGRKKEEAFTWHPRPAYPSAGQQPAVMGYSLRTNHLRYTRWVTFKNSELMAEELYDHRMDPRETVNQVRDSTYARDLDVLRNKMKKHIVSSQNRN